MERLHKIGWAIVALCAVLAAANAYFVATTGKWYNLASLVAVTLGGLQLAATLIVTRR